MPYALNASAAFTRAVEERNLTAAKDAYLATRPIYEQIEVCTHFLNIPGVLLIITTLKEYQNLLKKNAFFTIYLRFWPSVSPKLTKLLMHVNTITSGESWTRIGKVIIASSDTFSGTVFFYSFNC